MILNPRTLRDIDGFGVSPEYDGNEQATVHLGGYDGVQYAQGVYQAVASVDGTWGGQIEPMRMKGVTVDFESGQYPWAYSDSTEKLYYVIVKSDMTVVACVDVAGDLPGSSGSVELNHDLSDLADVVLEEDETYYHGFVGRRAAGAGANEPGYRRFNADQAPTDAIQFTSEAWGESLPAQLTGGSAASSSMRMSVVCKTNGRTLQMLGSYSGAASKIWLGHSTDHDYVIQLRGLGFIDPNALTVTLRYDSSANGVTENTLVFGPDVVTFDGNNIAIAGEAGDTFDVVINVQPSAGKVNVFWCNLSTGQGGEGDADLVWISHARENDAAGDYSHGQTYALAHAPQWIELSGTATVDSIETGWEPIIVVADSQGPRYDSRLGNHLPDAFTHPRVDINAAIPGNRIAATSENNHTAGYLRYCGDATHKGALCDISGALTILASFGLNDVCAIGTDPDDVNRDPVVSGVLQAAGAILDACVDMGNPALVMGLPPYSADGYASAQEAVAIRQINRGLHGRCVATRTAFYSPWVAMVDPDTINDAVPTFLAAYTADGGTHYGEAGAAIASAGAAAAYEDNGNQYDE